MLSHDPAADPAAEAPASPPTAGDRPGAAEPASAAEPACAAELDVVESLRRRPVFVVIAAYNEVEVIAEVIASLSPYVPLERVIVVDDASADGTGDVAADTGARVLRHIINRGQGAALATGIAAALRLGAEAVVTFDADGQHDPDDLPKMVRPVFEGRAEVVLGTRFAGGRTTDMPWHRRAVLGAAIVFTWMISQIKVSDTHNGFRVFSRDAAEQIQIREDRMAHASEILDEIRRLRLSYVERPVHIRYSEYSLGKGQRSGDAVKLAMQLLLRKVSG